MKERNAILQELSEWSPNLHALKLKGSQPFRVPEGYFEELPSQMADVLKSPLNEAQLKTGSFTVPEGYFNKLPGQIMERIRADEQAGSDVPEGGRVVVLSGHRRRERVSLLRLAPMAAAVAIFILLGVLSARFFIGSNDAGTPEMAISQEEALDYLATYWVDFEDDELLALAESDESISFLEISGVTDEDWLEYLEENPESIDAYLLTGEI